MYDFKKIEKEIEEFWEKNKIYEKVKELTKKRGLKNKKKFFFVDGPPFATGEIHPGTAWNKVMKDIYIRYYRAKGFDVRDQPGFDTHGLPIEVKVEKLLKINKKHEIEKLGIDVFIKKCKEFVDKYIEIMTKQMKAFGVWMDWENPYVTYYDNYIERSWETFKRAFEKNLLEEGDYVVPYCFRCETSLANYELEYKELTDPSVYVKFKVKGEDNLYLIIWTTTPWTLIGNMGVMVNPNVNYVEIEVEGERWIIAKELVEEVMEKLDKSYSVLREIPGKELKGINYEHPFQEKIRIEFERKVVLSEEFVGVEEGTGLVHMAPAHGPQDYLVGKENNIPIYSPVNENGDYNELGGEFKGKNVREANEEIIKLLEEKGNLVLKEKIRHRYPICWRCKTPLIYLVTKQWFIKITKLKEEMLKEIDNIEFSPSFVKERFSSFVKEAPDWCISRQRYWGIPLPIWKCKKGHLKVVGSKKELGKEVKELHRPYVDEVVLECHCGEKMERVKDVLDVWFDSGNAVWAPLTKEEEEYWGNKADLIFEGQDQIRGWFYSLLGSGMVRNGSSPYKRLLMHGFFVDEKGEKMSKSIGNFVPVEEILSKVGADSFRLWGASSTTWEEVKFVWDDLRLASRDLNVLINLASYLERVGAKREKLGELKEEDKWIMDRLEETIYKFNKSMKELKPFEGVRELRKLLIEDLSQFYMKIAKKRQEETKALLYHIVFEMLKMFAIITPYTSEYVYQKFFRKFEGEESIHMFELGEGKDMEKDEMEEIKEVVSAVLKLRNELGIKLRWPIEKVVVNKPLRYERALKLLTNSKAIEVGEVGEGLIKEELEGLVVGIPKELSEELKEEGLLNEVVRRIQATRKELKLIERDEIILEIKAKGKIKEVIEKYKVELLKRVNGKEGKVSEGLTKKWKIEGEEVEVKIRKS